MLNSKKNGYPHRSKQYFSKELRKLKYLISSIFHRKGLFYEEYTYDYGDCSQNSRKC